MQLEPQQEYVLARGLEDHMDSSTYYVRAVIRNAKTDALIATVNLTDNGSRRFTKAWMAPADPTGLGLDILITYTVYTDSNYTTKAENYGERFDEHTVLRRPNPNLHGGGSDISYKKVREIVAEELDKRKVEPKETKEVDLVPISQALQSLFEEVRAIKIPEAEKVNLKPVLEAIQGVKTAVDGIDIPKVDLTGIEHQLYLQDQKLDKAQLESIKEQGEQLLARIKEFYGGDVEEIKTLIGTLQKQFDSIAYVTIAKGPKNINDDQP